MKPQKIYHAFTCKKTFGGEDVCIEFFNENGDILYNYSGVLPVVRTFAPRDRDGSSAKYFTNKFGVTPSNLCKIIAGVVLEKVVKAHPEWDKLFASKRSWHHGNKFEYIEYEPEMQQCRKDGIPHLIPFVGKFGKTPQELKKHFGAAKWKKVCKNTYSRNKLLANTRVEYEAHATILNLKSDALRYVHNDSLIMPMSLIDDIRKDLKLKSYKAMHKNSSYILAFNIVRDTLRGVPNAKLTWSYRRFKEEHAKMVQSQTLEANKARAERDEEYAKRLKINFKDLHSWLEPVEFESGVKAIPLMNMQEVILEGSTMRHCVGSYAELAARGGYVVWHLTKGEVEATLGINAGYDLVTCRKYSFQQMYGKFNEIIADGDFKKAADWIVDKMNSSAKIQSIETQTGEEVEYV